ncbi:hypothetical protein DFR24_0436 [Panacagrimonas perspica]|uniref:Uncharacterized protein n=2 Tax=Panacagrimonas perspica TaxID=381431 RepID=A0A4R7PAW0_9GAMM|nr:hypothetical protein DFR24_0436 [Panacagrimonas perspica]THD01781.1 hypothetical protein B1810_17385 [Panacagrimonas perspica]
MLASPLLKENKNPMLPESIRLAANAYQAVRSTGLQLGRSIFGDPESRAPGTCPPTEFQLIQPDALLKSTLTLAHLAIPGLPRRLPAWARVRPRLKPAVRMVFRPSKVYRYRPARPFPDPTPDQAWFFINGICADRQVLMLNASYLTDLFGRPLTLLHDSTCSLLSDLAECAFGKGSDGVCEAARMAFAPIYVALKQPACKRVVLLAHSQGSAVTSVLLWLLRGLYPPTADELLDGEARCPEQRIARALAQRWGFPCAQSAAARAKSGSSVKPELTREELAKLEIYAFGNCASLMGPIDRRAGFPYIESYGNEFDAVARLGVLAPGPGPREKRIGGERFMRRGAWGHLLNAHYLWPMEQEWRAAQNSPLKTGLRPLPGNSARQPRLFGYFGGATPKPLFETPVEAPRSDERIIPIPPAAPGVHSEAA